MLKTTPHHGEGSRQQEPAPAGSVATAAPAKSRPPTSRLGRLARLGALATHALPMAIEGAKRAFGVKRTEEDAKKVRERMLADARKAAARDAQDAGRDEGRAARSSGRWRATSTASPRRATKRSSSGCWRSCRRRPRRSRPKRPSRWSPKSSARPPNRCSRPWERQPFAAASIGQVHRAVTQGASS